ncbi:MAG: 16S rRNA processing protein RimM [Acidimicrobiaceae bacterium]|nr:16S rRNA processing protein RimM [Acidimicrobiaceae bacterium]MBA4809622.1 16S rRNA processing protein RimM [Acidimicrobiales bacterium]MBC84167.1 16S rRNA processing protein RimM [Acidimicrobiaceae bacterium]|tara:strand:+ start:161 stop:661 length:501 start_codon:yes stop_codon:yes gene_type:complete
MDVSENVRLNENMQLLEIGRIGKPHGLRGEVSVSLTTDREERVAPGTTLFLASQSELIVLSSKSHQKRYLVSFEGIDTRESADAISGEKLFARPLEDKETIWAHELIGKSVKGLDGFDRGKVVEIHANPASDLLVLDDETLVPVNFVISVQEDAITVETPKGIFPD